MDARAVPDTLLQRFLSLAGVLFTAYMVYAALFGPYKTEIVHLAILLAVLLPIFFLDQSAGRSASRRAFDAGWAALAAASGAYVIFSFERLLALWGAPFMTPTDFAVGVVLVLVVLEAARRTSLAFFLLAAVSIAYILWGSYLPGMLQHSGMDVSRFIYLTAFTAEGVFGEGLRVAAAYLFIFILLSSALQSTKTGSFLMDVCNARFGHMTGGPAKSAVAASAGLGTMTGSAIGNVVTTGAFTIPMMIRSGFKRRVAAAIEAVASEGAQMLPPVMGAGAFIMVEFTGIPYATIMLAALLPGILYFVSLFMVVHIEALRHGLTGLPREELPSARQAVKDGWHLLVAPMVLLYLLIVEGYTPNYAGTVCLFLALGVAMLRASTRLSPRAILRTIDGGVRQAAAVTALIAGIGFIQQAVLTTGLGPRFTEIVMAVSDGSTLATLGLAVVIATILGMGMPTPIAYILLAVFIAPAIEMTGVSELATHLFLFYFAIKSGSTPPVAMVAVVAASIAKANWWWTGMTAFFYSLPGFIVAFMFVYSPALLMQAPAIDILLTCLSALLGVLALSGGLQGWWLAWVSWPERAVLIGSAFALVHGGWLTDLVGFAGILGVSAIRWRGRRRPNHAVVQAAQQEPAARFNGGT